MIQEPQEAPQTFCIEQLGTDSVAGRRNDVKVQF